MKTFACLLLVLGVAFAQHAVSPDTATADTNFDVQTVINSVTDTVTDTTGTGGVATEAAAVGGAASAAASATATAGGATTGTASVAADIATGAGGLANRGTLGLFLGNQFYGPGLQNANAIRPNQQAVTIMRNYIKTAPNGANLRVFVDVDGTMQVTDQFGRETEIADPQVAEILEIVSDPFELQDRVAELRNQALEQAMVRCESELQTRFFNDPSAFTPALFRGVNIGVPGGPGAGGLAGAQAVVRA